MNKRFDVLSMNALRAGVLALLMSLGTSQAGAAILAPLFQFVDVPVAKPTMKQRVKAAIVNTALQQVWTIVENPDGSLTASMWKIREYDFKVRITYDADRYSITYLESQGLEATQGYAETLTVERHIESRQASEDKILKAIKAMPEAGAAVKTELHMHPAPNTWLRELVDGIRRDLAAPAY